MYERTVGEPQIYDTDVNSVFHFAFAKFMQIRLPAWILFQVFRDMPRQQNVTGIAAIHHALRWELFAPVRECALTNATGQACL